MSHTYRKDGPKVDAFTFDPDTRIFTVGGRTYTFPVSGSVLVSASDIAALTAQVAALQLVVDAHSTGLGFTLPTADPHAGSYALWDNSTVITGSNG